MAQLRHKSSNPPIYSTRMMSSTARPLCHHGMSPDLHNAGPVVHTSLACNPTEGKGNGDTILTQPPSDYPLSSLLSRLCLNPGTKVQLYLRLLVFSFIEMGYITLAAICLVKPIPLRFHLDLTDSEVKAGFTVIFVVWQSLAILMGSCIAVDGFSQEWSIQLARITSGTTAELPAVTLERIDRVSTINSGFLDRTLHLFVEKSSEMFKLSFLASLLLLVLSSLGPGTINVATALIDEPTTIQIGRLLSHPQENQTEEVFTTQGRANLILRLEEIEHSPFGFKLPPNILVPVPKLDLTSFNGTIEYDSDVIEFHHDCHWEAPQFLNISGSAIILSAGQQWASTRVESRTGQGSIGSRVGSLSLTSFAIMEQVGTSAFIFSGGNSSMLDRRINPPVPFAVDLASLPTTSSMSGAGLLASNLYAPLSSVLVCDPHPQITGGRISITNSGTLTVIASGKAPIGNIPQSAANLIFANALQVALAQIETPSTANNVNNIASMMFMANSSEVDWNEAQNIHPLDLPSINQNMDTFMLSAAKAYIDGYTKNGSSTAFKFDSDTVSAMEREQRLALTTSKPLFIVTATLVAVASLLLLVLCKFGLARKRCPFDLNHVLAVLREGVEKNMLLLTTQDIGSEHTLAPHSHRHSRWNQYSTGQPTVQTVFVSEPTEEKRARDMRLTQSSFNRPQLSILSMFHFNLSTKAQLYIRLLAFFTIEMGYIILAAVCLAKPIPPQIHLDLTDSEIKGGFTIVFIVWQSLAILMGSYIVTDAFSREWSVQLERVPGTTDRLPAAVHARIDMVSTINSGFFDRTLHLFVKRSSGTFKISFLASLLLLALSSLGPGTINAGITLIDVPITIQIGQMRSQIQKYVDQTQILPTTESRADLILRLEEIEHSLFGFKLPPNVLAPLPMSGLASFNGTIEYDSDIIEFHHDCHWEAPQFHEHPTGLMIVTAAGQQWVGATVGSELGLKFIGSSVGPLHLLDYAAIEKVGTSAFIFSGGNNTVLDHRIDPPAPFAVCLESLPTTFNKAGAGLDLGPNSFYAPLSSILVCDPHSQITGGRIGVGNDGTLTIIASGKPPSGNIPQSAANLIFTNAFQVALAQNETLLSANNVNNIASMMMFMANSSEVDWNEAQNIRPLDLPSINQNMDTFMLSAAKAFIDGFTKNGSSAAVEFNLDTVPAMGREQILALMTSKPLFIVTSALVAVTTLLLLVLCESGLAQKRYPFDLNHVLAVLREDEGEKNCHC